MSAEVLTSAPGSEAVLLRPERAVEQACLGAALANDAAAPILAEQIETAAFASPGHREIHAAICRLVARDENVDQLTVAAELERSDTLALTPGPEYLYLLTDATPSAAHIHSYIARVKELAAKRRASDGCVMLQSLVQQRWTAEGKARAHAQLAELAALLEDDGRGDSESLGIYDGAGLAELKLEVPEALCDGLIYRGCSTDLVAEVKRGKTTLALAICRALIDGASWCGRATKKSGVLYLSEQSPHSFVPQVARAGLLGETQFCTVFHRDALVLNWPKIGEQVERQAVDRGLGLVVIDNLSLWAGIEGDEENDAGVALATLRVIERLTGAGLAVLVLRHARKGGGSISEAGRGSSALAGGFDVLVHMKSETRPRRRLLSVTGRVFAEEPPDWVLELGDDGHYRDLGTGAAVHHADARRIVLDLLPTSREAALVEEEILELCREHGIGKPRVQSLLRELCDEDDSARPCERARGAGLASNRAYGYWRRGDDD